MEPRPWKYPRSYLRLVSVTTSFAAILTPLDSTIVSISLPYIARGVGATYVEALWVPLGYLVSLSALLLLFGRLGDLRGRKRVFTTGFLVFIFGTVMCALSSNGLELDAWRAVQGLGGAMILSNSGAIITETYPPWERGKAFGYWSLAVYTGTTLGPFLGGAIVSARYILGVPSWRWVFLATVPPAVVGYALSAAYLRESESLAEGSLDLPAGLLALAGIWTALAGVTEGSFEGWGAEYVALVAAGAALLAGFVARELRMGRGALLDLALFRSVPFAAGNVAALLNYTGYFFVPFFLSYYMEVVLRVSPLLASAPLMALSLAMVTLSPVSGWLSDRIGARPLATAGMALMAAGMALLIPLGLTASVADVLWRTVLIGAGMGLFSSPNTASVMGAAPRDRLAVASGTLSVMRFAGQSLSLAIAGSLASAYIPRPVLVYVFTGLRVGSVQAAGPAFVEGLRRVYEVMVFLIAAGAAASALRGRH